MNVPRTGGPARPVDALGGNAYAFNREDRYRCRGTVDYNWQRAGLVAKISFPIAAIET
jgi:hypothetical protein